MSNLNENIQELEQQHAVFNLAPLTDDLSFSYLIEINQGGGTEYCGVSSIEEAMQTMLEHPFSTATINIGNTVPWIKFN
tara:strand:+ start:39 stop:275 length:237 start_codon:yes stop_codon:yes gene_type:complete